MEKNIALCVLFILIPMAKGAIPGSFFWRPRLGLDLSIPTTDASIKINLPNENNIKKGLVVLVNGYQVGMTIVALAVGISNAKKYPQINPLSAYFYTNAYRWALRHFSLLPPWIGGNSGSYCETHKVWRRRFFYMDEFMPKWMRYFFPYVDDAEWLKEEWEFRKYKKHAEPAFGKHYRYPNKRFNDFKSQETVETVENLDSTEFKIDNP